MCGCACACVGVQTLARACARARVRACVRLGRVRLRRPKPEREVLQELRVLGVGVHPVVLGVRERHHLALAAVRQRAREHCPFVWLLVAGVAKRQRQLVELRVEAVGLLLAPRLARRGLRVEGRCGLGHRHRRHATTTASYGWREVGRIRAKNLRGCSIWSIARVLLVIAWQVRV